MDVYDKVHELADVLSSCETFQTFKRLHEEMIKDPTFKQAIDEFKKKQKKLQVLQLQNQAIDQQQIEDIQKLYEGLLNYPNASEYVKAEMKFGQLMNDVYKIIGKSIHIS